MYVSYTSSDEYAPITGTSIYSLLYNNTGIDDITIFLLDLGITDANKRKIDSIVSSFNRKIEYIQIKNEQLERLILIKFLLNLMSKQNENGH